MSVNRLRIVAMVHRHLIPPDKVEEGTDITSAPWRTEYDVISTLRTMGHEVQVLGVDTVEKAAPPCCSRPQPPRRCCTLSPLCRARLCWCMAPPAPSG